MLKSECYKLLGLSEQATKHEIRKRYRELAMRYHPDRNPDPNAEQLFIKLTEAYDILLGRIEPREITRTRTSVKKEQSHEDRMRTARERFEEQRKRQQKEDERYFQFLTKSGKWKTIQVAAVLGSMIIFMMIFDLFLPHHFEKDEIIEYRRSVGRAPNGQEVGLVRTINDRYFFVSQMKYDLYNKHRVVVIESSWFFHNPIQLISFGKVDRDAFDIHFTVYKAWWLIVFILALPIITTQYKKRSVSFTLLYHLSYFGTSIAISIFLITGHRWAHFLTFGIL